jgi:gluconolactonase
MKKLSVLPTLVLLAVFGFANQMCAQEHAADQKDTVNRSIEKLDDAFDALIDTDAEIEQLSSGHKWTEGPVWNKQQKMLLFCDIPNNEINRWDAATGKVSIYMKPSGYDGIENEFGKEPGTNGLIYGHDGRLIACDHGNRRLYRLYEDGSKATLIDRFEGKRFNSPNDLVMDKAGNIYFTDPPYGMLDESVREIDWHGVYRLTPYGVVTLLTKEFTRPNGIGLSPDQKTLYVAQSDKEAPIYKAFPLNEDGTIGEGKLLYDAASLTKDPGMPDGMAIDQKGNLWATGPGGVLIITPEGKLLGRILMNKPTANCTFGDDGSTLYITSSGFVCRVKTKAKGLGFGD